MPQIINTNVASLNAQRNLNRSQGDLSVALQLISSGLRVNSARDDAAGLAIANRMTTQFRGFNQAARNAADAISLAQTGEGSLQEITNNVQRMRELAVQSRNATNTAEDRASLDAEFQQLLAENDRIAQTTSFNGRNVLDGTLGSSVFQVGANVGDTISIDVSSSMRNDAIGAFAARTFSLATDGTATDGDTFDLTASNELTINGTAIDAAADNANGAGDGSAISVAAAINAKTTETGVTATAGAATNTATAANIAGFQFDTGATAGTFNLTINGTSVLTLNVGDTPSTATELASAINTASQTTGVVANVQTNGDLLLTASDGRNIEIQETSTVTAGTAADDAAGFFGNTGIADGAANFEISKGTIELTAQQDINVTFETAGLTADVEQMFGLADGSANANTSAQTIEAANVLTESDSDLAIRRIDQALRDVDTLRGTFGAIQSRFESTIANLQTSAENAAAARSRIVDADFAMETAALTRAQILQQAGVSILAQANSLPQSALALLQ
jgi:flagellin